MSKKWNRLIVVGLLAFGNGVAVAQQQQQAPQRAQPQQTAQAPIVGAQPVGITVEEQALVAKGWSSRKDLVGKAVYNDKGEKIGTVNDLIIAPDRMASFAVISTGGFVGLSKHDVAIPFSQLQLSGDRIMLPGATKDTIKALPEFVYAR